MNIVHELAAQPQPVPLEANGLVAGVEALMRIRDMKHVDGLAKAENARLEVQQRVLPVCGSALREDDNWAVAEVNFLDALLHDVH